MSPAALKIDDLDRVIHERARLAIVSALVASSGGATFQELRAAAGLTDGNFSVHLRILEEAGYTAIEKSFVDRRPRTNVRLTSAGRRAFKSYLAVLEGIVKRGRR